MRKVFHWIWDECLEILPIVILFFVGLNFINISLSLMFHEEKITAFTFTRILVGSLVAGKLLLLVDFIPCINAFKNRPMMYNTIWKTFVYSLAALIYRFAEPLVRYSFHYKSLALGYQHLLSETDWDRFWGVQLLVTALLAIFVISRELALRLGGKQLEKILFGRVAHWHHR